MNESDKSSQKAAFGNTPKAASFLPHLGEPPLSFLMPAKYMGWLTTSSGPLHRYFMACGHIHESHRRRHNPNLIFCPNCADLWAEQGAEPETIADRLELTDAGYAALEAADPRCGSKLNFEHVTEDKCQIPPRGFPTNP